MVKFFRIKQKARGLARQQKFDQALAEYRAAIAQAEAESDAGAVRNLYNAAGDAALQKNDTATAVEYWDKAADGYLEEGLYDNAIALCHKILRHVPTKAEVYAKLGTIYREKGFRSEALQNWLEYAERREKANDLAGVTRALREVVALAPESDAIRRQLAEILLRQRDARGALVELEELRRRAETAGDAQRAGEVEARMIEVRREYGVPAGAGHEPASHERTHEPTRTATSTGPGGGLGVERFELADHHPAAEPSAGGVVGLDTSFGLAPATAPSERQAVRGAGPRPAHGRSGSSTSEVAAPVRETANRAAAPREGRARTAGKGSEAAESVAPIWRLPGFTPPPSTHPPPPDETAGSPGPAAPVEGVAGPAAKSAAEAFDLPPIAFVPVEERIARAEARLAEDPENAEERIYLGELYQEAGALDLARAAMEQGARELLAAGQHEKAFRAYRRVVALAPEELDLVQKLVEVAQTTGSRENLIQSSELLGDRLMEAGRYTAAAEIHRRILAIDPEHRHSQDQLLILEGLETAPAPVGTGSEGASAHGQASGDAAADYVDLEALLAEGEVPVSVPAPPGGGGEAGLSELIDTFRRGVSANIPEGDFESHYDLGVAFREMGLLDEAIRAFQEAARGREHRERAFELMGLCFREKGMLSVAANCFRRGLEGERDPHQALGLRYHLARSLEELGDKIAAREEYAKVVALDVQFMDAAERLKSLEEA